MSPDYLKLFMDKRLTTKEPHHLDYIKGRLANMKVDDPKQYAEYSAYYGVDIEVKVTKEPKVEKKEDVKEEVKAEKKVETKFRKIK